MTKFVSCIGNGESRRGFDITPLKQISTVIGCNAIFRDHNLEYIIACDRHMCQEAANTCGKNTNIYTRENWHSQFSFWPNVKKVPALPYEGDKRQDDPFHWCTGQFAALLGMTFKPKAIFLIGMDLWGNKDKDGKTIKGVEGNNNIYRGTKGYTYIKRAVDPRYWRYQFNKLFEHSDCRWIVVNEENWEMPEEWKVHKHVFQETYEGLAKWINKELTKSK